MSRGETKERETNSSTVINWYLLRTSHASPSPFNFLVFAPAFSIVSIVYLELGPRYASWMTHPFASLALEAINTIFYFGGFIALAIFLSKLVFCTGAVCAVARATSILAATEFVSWIATTMILAKDIFKNGAGRPNHEPKPLAARRVDTGREEVSSVREIHSGFDFGWVGQRFSRTERNPDS